MSNILLMVIAVFLPPLAVALEDGIGTQFWINLVLTIVGFWILGIIHAFYVILTR